MARGRKLRIGALVSLVVILMGIMAAMALHAILPPEKVTEKLLPHVEKAIGRKVELEGAGLSFYPVFGLRLDEVTVANTDRPGFSPEPFVAVDEFLLSVKILPLLQKRLEIAHILLKKPRILLETDSTGAFNYEDLGGEKQAEGGGTEETKGLPPLPIPLTLQKFTIQEGTIHYHDRQTGRTLTIGSVEQQVNVSIDKQLRDIQTTGELALSQINLEAAEIPAPLSDFTLTLNHDIGANLVEGTAEVRKVRASLQNIALEMSGTVSDLTGQPRYDLKLASDTIPLATLLREIPTELVPVADRLEASGTMMFAADIRGVADSSGLPPVKGTAGIADGMVKYADFPKAVNRMEAEIAFTTNSLTVSRFDMHVGENPVTMKARVRNFEKPELEARLEGRIDLGDIGEIVELPEGIGLSGMVASNISAKGLVDPSNPSALELDGTVDIKGVRATAPQLAREVKADGKVTLSNESIDPKVTMNIGSSDLAIRGSLRDYLPLVLPDTSAKTPRPSLAFDVHSSLMDLDEMLAQSAADSASGASGDTTPSPILPAPLPGIDMKGTARVDKLVYQRMQLRNAVVDIASVNDVMTMKTRADAFEGSLRHTLKVDVSRGIEDVRVENRVTARKMSVNNFVSQANDMLPETKPLYRQLRQLDNTLHGSVNLESSMATRGATVDDFTRNLAGTVSARLSDGNLRSGPLIQATVQSLDSFLKAANMKVDDMAFRTMRFEAEVRDESLIVDSVTIDSDAGEWRAEGRVGFDAGLDLAVRNRLTAGVSRSILDVTKNLSGSVKGLAGQLFGSEGAAVADQLVSGAGPAADRQGRITVAMKLGGTLMAPRGSGIHFAEPKGAAAKAGPKKKPAVKARKKAQAAAEDAKQQAREKLEAEKRKREEQARQAAEEAKQKAAEKAEDIKNKAAEKLKGFGIR
jgi:uncharacterized protein involved in outer membrane biogenesis